MTVTLKNHNSSNLQPLIRKSTKEVFWNKRRIQIAVRFGTIAVVSIVAAALLFIPGAPLAIIGIYIATATLTKLGLSLALSKLILEAVVLIAPTAIAAAATPAAAMTPKDAPLPYHSITIDAPSDGAPLPYHQADLCLISDKHVKYKLQEELCRAKQNLELQESNEWGFSICSNKSCNFEIHKQSKQLLTSTVGIAHAQGQKKQQEDVHIASFGTLLGGSQIPYELFGIVDGHAGIEAAQYVQDHLKEEIVKAIQKHGTSDLGIRNALKEAFVQLDAKIACEVGESPGAVAVVSLKIGTVLWTANVGDCRAILKSRR